MIPINKDTAAGALFIAIGGFFALNAMLYLRIGRALSMGPGYFPVILGGLLIALGIAIAIGGFRSEGEPIGTIPWRGLVMVLGSILVFAATVRGAGIGPALAISILMATRASTLLSWRTSIVLTAVLTVFSILVFVNALGLPYPVFGRWLTF